METRLEQQPRQKAAPHMRHTTVQAQQAQRQADINEKVAVALERLNGRMEALENWRKDEDERRDRYETRRDSREDRRPELSIAHGSLAVSGLVALIYVIQLIAAHWH